MQIKIGKVPGRTQVLELQEGATIAEAVRQAGLDVTGHELRFNGVSTEDFNKEVTDGAIVLLTPRIKGNMDSDYITVYFHNVEYVVSKNSTVNNLLYTADWDDSVDEDEDTVAIFKNNKWIAVNNNERLVPFGKYDVFNIEDVEVPETPYTCNCGGNCGNGVNIDAVDESTAKIIVGEFEITIRKR